MAEVINLIQAEGFTGQKKSFHKDPWPDIYASRQSKNAILQGMVTAVEEYSIGGKDEDDEKTKIPCAVVMMGYVKGLIPLPESNCTNRVQLRKLIGQLIVFKVIAIQEKANLFVASRKQAIEQMAKATWDSLKKGDVKTAVVRDVHIRGAKLDIGGIGVEITADQMSWGWVNDVRELVQPGDSFDVKIVELDKKEKKIQVSLRELIPCPWPDCMKRYSVGMEVLGTVYRNPPLRHIRQP